MGISHLTMVRMEVAEVKTNTELGEIIAVGDSTEMANATNRVALLIIDAPTAVVGLIMLQFVRKRVLVARSQDEQMVEGRKNKPISQTRIHN